jgi:hypothetical protein
LALSNNPFYAMSLDSSPIHSGYHNDHGALLAAPSASAANTQILLQ